jgi:hypothetical protein
MLARKLVSCTSGDKMPKAMFVSLRVTYPQLSPQGLGQDAAALRNCTCVAWRVGAGANGVEYVFGVFGGRIVSAYKVTHPVLQDWPLIPMDALGGGRRCVPVTALSPGDWATALAWDHIPPMLQCGFRYGEVQLSNDGSLASFSFSTSSPTEEELAVGGDE